MKEKIKKVLKKILVMSIISLIFYFIFWLDLLDEDYAHKAQYLDNINYEVTINEDGSMKVVETWDIVVKNTNTLFKTFDLDTSKYSAITDVTVKEITNGTNKEFSQMNKYMYYVTKDYYYALNTSKSQFEIAWGIGLDNATAERKYQISYIVKDVVNDYNDCQEIYWKFLEKEVNEIPAKKVTGTVTLPQNVSDINNLKVWGHGQLNGEINKISENKIEFNLKNLRTGSMLEIRVITKDKMFNVTNEKIKNYNYLSTAINEETQWAEESNIKTNLNIYIGIYILVVFIYFIRILRCKKIANKRMQQPVKIEYFRDIPRDGDSTPAEALYLYKFNKEMLCDTQKLQQNAVSSTILNLCLKKKISLKVSELDEVYIKIIDVPNGLKKDEEAIYNLLSKINKTEWFNIKELNSYAHREYYEYGKSINELVNEARKNLYELGLVNKSEEKLYKKYSKAKSTYATLKNIYMWLIINHLIMSIPIFKINIIAIFGIQIQDIVGSLLAIIFPIMCLILYYLNLKDKQKNKIAVLTPNGAEEKAQWQGLEKYMKEYTLLDERTVPELTIWEKYLVYATAFGIADEVIKQMKVAYPEVFVLEKWNDERNLPDKYPVIYFMVSDTLKLNSNMRISPIENMNLGLLKAYETSKIEISRHSSSSRKWKPVEDSLVAEAAGGGRWPEWEVDKNYFKT